MYKIVPGIYHGKHKNECCELLNRFVSDAHLHRSLYDSLEGTIVDDYSFNQLNPCHSKPSMPSLVVHGKEVTLIF